MLYLKSFIISILQGLTEFLPVSSSGHLQLGKYFFDLNFLNVEFDIIVHAATMLATLIIFKSEILSLIQSGSRIPGFLIKNGIKHTLKNTEIKYLIFIIIGIIPAGLTGVFFKDFFESIFSNLLVVGFSFLFTTILLFLTKLVKETESYHNSGSVSNLPYSFPIIVGLFQAAAIFPGISRSGSTISASLFAGANRKTAGSFSFIISIPLIAGALLLDLRSIAGSLHNNVELLWIYLISFMGSFISGYIALRFLLIFIKKGKLYLFGFYTLIAGLLTIYLALK